MAATRREPRSVMDMTADEDEPFCGAQVNHPGPSSLTPKGREFIDFDEDLVDIVNATRLGCRDVQLVKRYSTVGIGPLRAATLRCSPRAWWQKPLIAQW